MAISASDIKVRLSTKSGSAGNSLSQSDVNESLGKYISTTDLTDNALNNLFDDISGDENAISTVDYRCIFIYNSHGSLTYISPYVWISNQISGGADIAIGLDTTSASAVDSASAQALSITNETTAPVGVSFSAPSSKSTGIALGNIPNGQCIAIWVRRTANNTSAVNNDGATISISGDTAA